MIVVKYDFCNLKASRMCSLSFIVFEITWELHLYTHLLNSNSNWYLKQIRYVLPHVLTLLYVTSIKGALLPIVCEGSPFFCRNLIETSWFDYSIFSIFICILFIQLIQPLTSRSSAYHLWCHCLLRNSIYIYMTLFAGLNWFTCNLF